MKMTKKWLLVAIFCFAWLWAPQAMAGLFDEVVVFGDSLSDNGNLLVMEDQAFPDQSLYYEGRFSNGRVWIEYLTDPERLNACLADKAFGGAESSSYAPLGLIQQVGAYITAELSDLSSEVLFAIWIGGNDCLNEEKEPQESVENIQQAMEMLVNNGARHILVLNLPDLGTIPRNLGTDNADYATTFSEEFNTALAEMLDTFSLNYPEVGLYDADIHSFFQLVQNNPAGYGFSNVTESCPNFELEDTWQGLNYVFWDDIHPTTQMHTFIADKVYEALNQQVSESDLDESESGSSADDSCFINTLAVGR